MLNERSLPARSMLLLGHVIKEESGRSHVEEIITPSTRGPHSPKCLLSKNGSRSSGSSTSHLPAIYLKDADADLFDHGTEIVYRIAEKSPMDWLSNNHDTFARDVENAVFRRGKLTERCSDTGFVFAECAQLQSKYTHNRLSDRAIIVDEELADFQPGDSVKFVCQMVDDTAFARFLRRMPQPADWENMRYVGQLKSFSSTSGYGFIGCPETFELYGRDVFVHQNQAEGLALGEQVEFGLIVKNGQPQAHDVRKASIPRRSDPSIHSGGASPAQPATDESCGPTPRTGQLERGGTQGSEGTQGQSEDDKPRPYPHGILMQGVLKSYNCEKGYGFISCKEMRDHFNKDVFVHSNHVQNFTVGDRLKFYVEIKNERPQALDVEVDNSSDDRERFIGVIKSFASSKGYGFIECKETEALYRRDVFVHRDQMKSFLQGDWVSFIAQEKNGQPQAENLETAQPPEVEVEPEREEPRPQKVPFRSVEKRLMRLCFSHGDSSRDMETLLVGGADPNYIDFTGSTPLMSCALNLSANACWQKIRTLLRFGASIDMNVGMERDQKLIDWVGVRIGTDFKNALLKLNDHISSSEDNPNILDELDINFCVSHPSELD